MSRWHNIRIRGDLYRVLEAQAVEQSRSTTGQLDFVLTRALEQETNTSASSGGGPSREVVPGESARGAEVGRGAARARDALPAKPAETALSPARASDEKADGEAGVGKLSHRPSPSSVEMEGLRNIYETTVKAQIAGQMTVDEMLASCPQCAGEMQDYCLDDGKGGGEMATRCEDCGFVREPEGT